MRTTNGIVVLQLGLVMGFCACRRYILLFILSFACCSSGVFAQSQAALRLDVLGRYSTGVFGASAAEISAYDPATKRLFMINAQSAKVDVISIANPVVPTRIAQIDATPYGAGINSVAVHNGIVAVAVESANKQANGHVVFFSTAGVFISQVEVGALPDMVTFTPDGTKVLVANEGEPNGDYTDDPEGSVSIIDLTSGAANVTQSDVATAGFTAFNNTALDASVRIFGPNATVAQDLEPEYIAVSADSRTAWVTLQENNAIAVIDIPTATVTAIKGLGFKDHNITGNGLDASDRDNAINIRTWPVKGMYQPDAIAAYTVNGNTYLVAANEGDARDYDGFAEEERVGKLKLDPAVFPASANYTASANLGRLTVTKTLGDANHDGLYEELYAFGARSFSIRAADASLIWDSGDELERITAQQYPNDFNANNDENQSFENRSDNKGPEPEGVAIGRIDNKVYAFIGLERIGGVMVYDITNPQAPVFVVYVNPRNFSATNPELAGDLGPEGLLFIPRSESPNKRDLLVVSNEISGTVAIYQIMPQLTQNSSVRLKSYNLRSTPSIGMYKSEKLNDIYYEGGISGLDRVLGSDNEFMMITDRGPNVVADKNPLANGQAVKLFPFPMYAPKIFRVKAEGDSLRILETMSIKRPDGTDASGLPNPGDAGGTGEVAWSSTTGTTLAPDEWGLDCEGIVEGNNDDYWICEEYGVTVWNIDKKTGRVINRYTPFGTSDNNIGIPPVFAKRRENRGFEGVAITPSGKVYAIVQGPLYNPDKATGNSSRLHRILEIDPTTKSTRMFAYEHDAAIGQIRSSDWKIGDMVAVNDREFLVIEHAERNGWNYKNIYKIDISTATPITREDFNGKTFEQLNDAAGARAQGITPVAKTLFFDLLENNWNTAQDKPEGLTILNETTFAVINDNDYGVDSPAEDGVIVKTGKTTTLYVYTVPQEQKLNYVAPRRLLVNDRLDFGYTGQAKRMTTTIKNTSNIESLTVQTIGVTGNAGSYQLLLPGTTTPLPLTTTIAANGSVTLDVVFGTQGIGAVGHQPAQWNIQHSGTNTPRKVEFTGYFANLQAQSTLGDLLVPNAVLDLGTINSGATGTAAYREQTIGIAADTVLPTDAPIVVQSFSIEGPDASMFSVTAGITPGMSLGKDERSVTIAFNGNGATSGVKRATLLLQNTAANGPATAIRLVARVGHSVLFAPTLVTLPVVRQGQVYATPYDNIEVVPLEAGTIDNVSMIGAPQLFGVDASAMEIMQNMGKYYLIGRYDANGRVVIGGDGDIYNAANWLTASVATPAIVSQGQPLLLVVRMKQPNTGAIEGTYSALLTVASSTTSGAVNTITSTLVGRVELDPNAAPGTVDFGTVPVGLARSKTVTLRSAVAGQITAAIPADNNFTFADGSKTTTIAMQGNGTAVTLDVVFMPNAGGAQETVLAISGILHTEFALKGTGVAPSLSLVHLEESGATANDVQFGTVMVGHTKMKHIVVVNNNVGPVWITSISRSGINATQFSVGTPSSFMVPGNGGSITLPVSFIPTSVSPLLKSAMVSVNFTAGMGALTFSVTGTATNTAPQPGTLMVSPTSWDFGTVTNTKIFTLTNNLSTPVTVLAALITTGDANFSVVDAASTFPRTVAANGGTTTITVRYTQSNAPAAGALLLYTPGVDVYPTATLRGGNYARIGQASAITGQPLLELQGSYPNPFAFATTVQFRLHSAAASVVLRVYNAMGQLVATVDGGAYTAGEHNLRLDAAALGSGMYFYSVEADGEQQHGSMVIFR